MRLDGAEDRVVAAYYRPQGTRHDGLFQLASPDTAVMGTTFAAADEVMAVLFPLTPATDAYTAKLGVRGAPSGPVLDTDAALSLMDKLLAETPRGEAVIEFANPGPPPDGDQRI